MQLLVCLTLLQLTLLFQEIAFLEVLSSLSPAEIYPIGGKTHLKKKNPAFELNSF